MKFLWASVLLAMVATPTLAQYPACSPVFNMLLQPAPSPRDGGFYWVMPDGRIYGPNYNLYPPFTPVAGFDTTLVGQVGFAQTFDAYRTGKLGNPNAKPGQPQPNPQQPAQPATTGTAAAATQFFRAGRLCT